MGNARDNLRASLVIGLGILGCGIGACDGGVGATGGSGGGGGGGHGGEAPPVYAAPATPALVDWTCPPGWRAVPGVSDLLGEAIDVPGVPAFTACEPPGVLDCPEGTAQFPGETDCGTLGTPCPAGDFLAEAIARDLVPDYDGDTHWVQSGGAGAGTEASPFATLTAAYAAASAGDVILLAKGTYSETRLTQDVALVGSCVAETVISGAVAEMGDAHVAFAVPGGGGALANVRLTGPRLGVRVLNGGDPIRLRAVELTHTMSTGLLLYYFDGVVELEEIVVRDTDPWSANGAGGQALSVVGEPGSGTPTVRVHRAVFERSHTGAVAVSGTGTALTLEDVAIRDTQPAAGNDLFGGGLEVMEGAAAMVTRALFAGNLHVAVNVHGAGSQLTLTDVVIRDTRPQVADGLYGIGLMAQADTTAERLLVAGNTVMGIQVSNGAALDLSDAIVRDTANGLYTDDRYLGIGCFAALDATLTGERLVLQRSHRVGLAVTQAAAVEVQDLLIYDTRATLENPDHSGVGAIVDDGELTMTRAVVALSVSGGVESFNDATLTATDLIVRKVHSRESDGSYGHSLLATTGGDATISQAILEQSRFVGLFASSAGTVVNLDQIIIRDTLPGECGDLPAGHPDSCITDGSSWAGGSGLVAMEDAVVFIDGFEISQSALAGIQVAHRALVSATNGRVVDNVVGINAQDDSYDFDTIADSVAFIDNETKVVSDALPLPDPFTGSGLGL